MVREPSEVTPSLKEGEQVSGYVIEARIGVGGFGEVYRARHPVIGREVAIKVLHGNYSADREAISRFVDEARAVNQISHPNIVEVFDFGKLADGREFCVMELIAGTTLRDLLRARTRLPLAEALPILRGIAEAVDAAHAAGIAHRDLKPDNVFVLPDGGTKLIDFGLAKLTRELDAPVTQTGSVFGTPIYMSPEQCRGKATDTRTDLYSFGVLAYHVLVGEPPFGGDALELALHHLNDQPTPPSKRCKELSRNADRVVLALLAKDPADRPESLVNSIDALAGATTLRARRWNRRVRRGALLAIAVAAVATVGVMWKGNASDPEQSCAPAAERLVGVWDSPMRVAVAATFAKVDRVDVAATWRFATRDLDAFAARWTDQWDRACHAPDRKSDPLLHAQRENCLERALIELRAASESLRDVEPGSFSAGWNGVLFESSLADCERVEALRAMPPVPAPEHRDEVAQLALEIERARADARTVFYADPSRRWDPTSIDTVLSRLDSAATRLDALEAAPAAEAAMVHADISILITAEAPPRVAAARVSVARAIALARKRRDDPTLAIDYVLQAELELRTTGSIPKIEESLARSDEANERSGHSIFHNGSPQAAGARVGLEIVKGEREQAITTIRAMQRDTGSAFDHWRTIAANEELVVLLSHYDRHAEAIEAAKRELALVSDAWGADHSMVADAHELLMLALYEAGDLHGALDEVHAATAVRERIHASPSRSYRARLYQVMIADALGLADERESATAGFFATLRNDGVDPWLWLAQVADANARYELGAWALARSKAPQIELDNVRAIAAWLRGDIAGIEAPARRVIAGASLISKPPTTTEEWAAAWQAAADRDLLALVDAHAGRVAAVNAYLADHARFYDNPDRISAGYALMADGYVCIALASWGRARTLLERAKTVAATAWVNSSWGNLLDAALGRALLETGDASGAIPRLESALWENHLLTVGEIAYDRAVMPGASFALARALWETGGDKPRARSLATHAIAAFGKFREPERQQAIRWLADHPAQ